MNELWPKILATYEDPAFFYYTVGMLVVNVTTFLVMMTPVTLFDVKKPAWAEPYKIQTRAVDNSRLFWPSLGYYFLNNGLLLVLAQVVTWPVMYWAGMHWGPLPPWYTVLWQVIFCMYLDDFLYYFAHRVFHTPWLFRKVHYLHHSVKTPWGMNAHYMHPVELLMTGFTVLAGPAVLGVHVFTLFCWIVVRQWTGVAGHCGYEFRFDPLKLLPGYRGNVFHDFHHSRCDGNYSGGMGYLDGLFGTWAKGYKERDQELKQQIAAAVAAKRGGTQVSPQK